MHQCRLATLQRMSVVQKIMCSHPLQHRRRGLLIADSGRNRNQPIRGHSRIFRIGSEQARPCHAVSQFDRLHLRAHRRNNPGAFLPGHERQRSLVPSFAMITINKVHARSGQLHQCLVRLRLRDRQLHQFHHLRTTHLLDLNGFHDCFGFLSSGEGTLTWNYFFSPAVQSDTSTSGSDWLVSGCATRKR